jgi:electron transfer flavoprotein beta subunit
VPYDSVVCVKQVPDTANVTAEAMKEDGTVNRAALPTIFNPEDLYALETALEIKDRHGGTVTAISMGPPKAADVLRDCLFRGADRAILITDRRAAASDTLATSYILSQAVRTVGRYDFVFCGRQAIDGDTAQVGPQCAEKLGIPQITYLEQLIYLTDAGETPSPQNHPLNHPPALQNHPQNNVVRIRRNIGHGWEIVEAKLPVLVTVLETANPPRPPSVKRIMHLKKARAPAELINEAKNQLPGAAEDQIQAEAQRKAETLKQSGLLIEQWNLDNINADLSRCGMSGSPTKVHRIQAIVLKKEGYTEIPPTETGVRQLIHELVVDRTLG